MVVQVLANLLPAMIPDYAQAPAVYVEARAGERTLYGQGIKAPYFERGGNAFVQICSGSDHRQQQGHGSPRHSPDRPA